MKARPSNAGYCAHKGCRVRIHATNTSGYCQMHYNQVCRPPRGCDRCSKKIQRQSKTGMCQACLLAQFAATAPVCAHPQCTTILPRKPHRRYCNAHREGRKLRAPMLNSATAETIRQVATRFNFQPADVISRNRWEPLVHARAAVCIILRQRGLSYNQIGRRLGMDHSSVMNLIARAPVYAARSRAFRDLTGITVAQEAA